MFAVVTGASSGIGYELAAESARRIEKGQIDPRFVISHRITLHQAPDMYKIWRDKKDEVTKIVIDPWSAKAA